MESVMSEREFREQLSIASALVARWPAWKKDVLLLSSRPTLLVARTPIIYSGETDVAPDIAQNPVVR